MINLVGLTAGLACTLIIMLWVRDEWRMDKFHEKGTRLYQVMEHQQYAGKIMTTSSTPGILSEALKSEIPEVEFAATTTWISTATLSIDDHNVKAKGYHVGRDYFQIFSYRLKQGDAASVLEDKYAIVISDELALRLFNTEENVVGKTIEYQHEKTFTVTGVFERTPASSSYQFDFVLNFEEFKATNEWVLSWGNNGPSTFIILHEGTSAVSVEEKIKDFIKGKNEQSNVTLFLKPYAERYLFGRYENGEPAGGRIEYVRLFSVVAIFILLIACINFMNLSTARSSRRAKEVGIKKAVGAQRHTLVAQYLTESVFTALLSAGLALFIVYLFLPQFNLITDKKITIPFDQPFILLALGGIALLTGLAAGSYPALFLSSFKPATVLKGEMRGSWNEAFARKGLVIFQFFISVILIVSVIVIYKQIEFTQAKSLGYKKDNLIRVPIEGKVATSQDAFINEIKRIPGVINASSMGHTLIGQHNNTSGLRWEGKNPDDLILFENVRVNYDLLETIGVELAEGRFFSRDYGADSTKIIFNETGIRAMNMEDPIGKTINLWGRFDLEIIGVVKDFHFQSLHEQVNPLFFILNPRNTYNLMIRLEGDRTKEAIEGLSAFYTTYNPGFTFDYRFQDEEYALLYKAEQRVATLSAYFAGFAILISCLGLFGLSAFTAERRQKEIGIRKVMGSSSTNIILLLSGDFTKMVFVSIALGLPASYYLLRNWLDRFAFHIELEVSYFLLAGLLAVAIAWFTVASQAFKASRINPAACLRTE